MILYDEFGQLLGADKESIELFSCSDITEFKEKVSDISDFFVNKEGYIHKFDHYNWIDFLNYSEEQIDKVLIKQDDNRAVEARVVLQEIYNLIEINGSKTTYMVDFIEQKITILEENKDVQKQEKAKETVAQNLAEEKIELLYDVVEEEFDIDKEFYEELLDDFIIESEDDLDMINAYMIKSDYQSILKIVNKLKNICTNLKLNAFLPILNSIDRSIKNKNYDNIEKFLNLYKKELYILLENLREL